MMVGEKLAKLEKKFNDLTSKNEFADFPIHEFKVLPISQRAFKKPLLSGVLVLIITLEIF